MRLLSRSALLAPTPATAPNKEATARAFATPAQARRDGRVTRCCAGRLLLRACALVRATVQLANESEGRQRAEGELREVRAAGVALYKQVRRFCWCWGVHGKRKSMQLGQLRAQEGRPATIQGWCARGGAAACLL